MLTLTRGRLAAAGPSTAAGDLLELLEDGSGPDAPAWTAALARLREDAAGVLGGEGAGLDRLAAEVDALEDEPTGADLRRLLHRIEVLLEVALREQGAAESCGESAPASAQSGKARPMTPAEAAAFLRGQSWGVLSLATPDGPYAVPVSFGFDGAAAYLATREGRKATSLRHDTSVCLTVVEVVRQHQWRSVVLRGVANRLGGFARMRGMAAIARQRLREPGSGSAADLRRAAQGLVYRIDPRELTGRVCGP